MTSLDLHLLEHVLPAAFALLPGRMDSVEARAMLVAIGLQESDEFKARRQYGNGPARGFWQFERLGGVKGVLRHELTKPIIGPICQTLRYPASIDACYTAIEHNDTLAAVFARLLLYTHSGALPKAHEAEKGWQQYLDCWRPGKPHPQTWHGFYRQAWDMVR